MNDVSKTKEGLSDLLIEGMRQAMYDRGLSQNAVSRACNIDGSNLSRFLAGKRSLSLDALDRVTAFLCLMVVRRDDWKRRDVVWRAWRDGELKRQWEDDWDTMRREPRPTR